MRKSANYNNPDKQDSQAGTDQQSYDSDNNNDLKANKKPMPIPRFIKNQIDEIDTQIIVLNISRTQYQVVQQVAKQLGWQVQRSKKSQKWDIMWIDSHIQAHDLFKLNEHQKISHFPAIYVLTRKNFLGRSLMKMRNHFPEQYNFFPSTWSIPADYTELLRYNQSKTLANTQNQSQSSSSFYIYKPQASAQGKGIKLYQNIQGLDGKNGIVQQYVNNPYLIQNLKFDLRIYVLIMGYDPLRIFIYDQGLGRFATQKYQKVKKKNMKDVHMHLTNYAINKNNKNFIFNNSEKDMNKGHKRSLTAIYNYLSSKGIDTQKLKTRIDQMIIKTLLVGQPMIAHTYGLAQADNNSNDLCFQILGFDVLINQNLDPILLQVNHTPSFKTDTPLDKHIKKNLIKDTLNLLNVNLENKKQKVDQKKQFIQMRSQRKLVKLTTQQKQQIRKKKWKDRDLYQMSHLGNFRKIFPTQQGIKYKQMIQMSNKIFNQAHGIKNKTLSNKLSFTTRPKSFEKKIVHEASPLLASIKQKILIDSKYAKAQPLKISQNISESQQYYTLQKNLLKSSIHKFPQINPKKQQKSRNFSGYMATSLKQQLMKSTPVQKIQRNMSYHKNTSPPNIHPSPYHNNLLQSAHQFNPDHLFKGNYVLPKMLQMGEITANIQKSMQFMPSQQSTHILSPTKTTQMHRIKNFQQIASQAFIQIANMTPPSKITYQNLLNSLSSSLPSNNNHNNNNNNNHNKREQYKQHKEQILRLRPVRKY